jgi:alpha-ribazole phosphatase
MPETILWLIRHPEPDASARGLCYGSLDVALSPEGVRRAELIFERLRGEHFDAIYTSPKQRCAEAARILAAGRSCPVTPNDALRELDFGAFEGLSYDDIAQRYPAVYRHWMEDPTGTEFPSGETFCQMSSRVLEAVRGLISRHSGQSIALVTHGGPIRVILADALGMPLANIFRIEQRYSAINRVRYSADVPMVEWMNA